MTFLIAGHDTTNVATCWALYLLAQYPHEQDLLREELYLNCVIEETLRTHTPLPTARRTNLKDEVIGKYYIPKNTEIFIGISVLQRLTEIWGPTTDNFDPKRWLNPSLSKNITNLNYLPYLNGARGCIGNKVALAEAKILLGFQIKKRVFPIPKPDPYLGLAVSIVES
ncbi:cytochrome P450 [Rhizophagus irregularis]|nr:cytochrome P450 [Rhizophagus irregularis]